MESDVRLTFEAQELLGHSSIFSKGRNSDGSFCIRHDDDVKFKPNYEYSYEAFAKKLGIKLPTESLLKKWAKLTDENEHTQVLIEIAKWAYENDKLQPRFKIITEGLVELELNNKRANCCLTPNARMALMEFLLTTIKQEFGKTVFRKIAQCL